MAEGEAGGGQILGRFLFGKSRREAIPKAGVGFAVKDWRIVAGGNGEENGNGNKDERAHPHAEPRAHFAAGSQVLANGADEEIDDEEADSHHQRHADTALADDSAQRCPNEKEEQTGEGQREFAVEFHVVFAEVAAENKVLIALEIKLRFLISGIGNCLRYYGGPQRQRHAGKKRCAVGGVGFQVLGGNKAIGGRNGR